jgi:hypothetical protein
MLLVPLSVHDRQYNSRVTLCVIQRCRLPTPRVWSARLSAWRCSFKCSTPTLSQTKHQRPPSICSPHSMNPVAAPCRRSQVYKNRHRGGFCCRNCCCCLGIPVRAFGQGFATAAHTTCAAALLKSVGFAGSGSSSSLVGKGGRCTKGRGRKIRAITRASDCTTNSGGQRSSDQGANISGPVG